MPADKANPELWSDLLAFERGLTAGAGRAVAQTQDPELAGLMQRIARRRRERSGAQRSAPRLQSVPSVAPGTLLSITRVAEQIAILRIARPAGFHFVAGQHVKLGVEGGSKNPYTIASAPRDPELEFCIESAPGGSVSPALCALGAGARVSLGARASGDFRLVPNVDLHIMLATVTGIAPFRSMLREALSMRGPSRFLLLHGASYQDELVYREQMLALGQQHPQRFRYVPSVSRPAEPRNHAFEGLTGRLTELAPALVQQLRAREPGRLQVYACGNPLMVAGVEQLLGALGVPVSSETFD